MDIEIEKKYTLKMKKEEADKLLQILQYYKDNVTEKSTGNNVEEKRFLNKTILRLKEFI